MKQYGFVKRIISGALAVCLSMGAAGIFTGSLALAQEGEEGAMGRYVESQVPQPESNEQMLVKDLVRMEDGHLRLVAESMKSGVGLWDSYDGGENWELAASLPEEYTQFYFFDLSLCPDGSGTGMGMIQGGIWPGSEGSESDYEYYYVNFDAKGNAQAISWENGGIIRTTKEGQMLNMTFGGSTRMIDRSSGETVQELASDVEMIGVCQREGLLLTASEVLRYDLTSGEPLEEDTALNEALYAGGASYADVSSMGHKIVFAEDTDGRLYYCTRNGIYSHVMGGSVVEQVVDGSLNSLGDPSKSILAMEICEGSFYVICVNGSGQTEIMKYTYDPNVASLPEKELTIYSLKEDTGIRQAAVLFQKMYPDTYINYEVGLNGEDGVTVSDALRTLNTDILAGNGPDILILDEMSVDTYIDKGMLTDLSGILEETAASEGLWENIAYTYQRDQAAYAVPSRFGIAMAAGVSSVLNRLENLESLAELAGEEGNLSWGNMAVLPQSLYYTCAGSWKNEDNTINREKLAEYVNALKKIYDNWTAQASPEDQEYCLEAMESLKGYSDYFVGSMGGDELNILAGQDKLALGVLMDIIDYAGYTSVNEITGDCTERLFGGQQQNVYIPIGILGVLSTAREPEMALEFVKYLLSGEGQTTSAGSGFPVNKTAYEAVLEDDSWSGNYSASSSTVDGESFTELVYKQPSQEERQWLTDAVASLSVCADMQRIQRDAVLEETIRCLRGELGTEEAVNSIMQKLNLYLAENQ